MLHSKLRVFCLFSLFSWVWILFCCRLYNFPLIFITVIVIITDDKDDNNMNSHIHIDMNILIFFWCINNNILILILILIYWFIDINIGSNSWHTGWRFEIWLTNALVAISGNPSYIRKSFYSYVNHPHKNDRNQRKWEKEREIVIYYQNSTERRRENLFSHEILPQPVTMMQGTRLKY